MLAILFTNLGNVNQALNLIDQNQRTIARAQGYTVDAGGIVGQDPAGNDVPTGQRTVRWDVANPTAGGTVTVGGSVTTAYGYWIADPRPRYGPAILNNVQNWAEGDFKYPPSANEV